MVVELDSPLLELFEPHRHSRLKVPHDPVHVLQRNLPDPEKPKDVVNPVGIEVAGKLREARPPPCIAVQLHRLPIVSRESPVLAFHRESIRRRARLHPHLEQMWSHPRIDRIPVHADRQIAFQRHPQRVHVIHRAPQLPVQFVLQPDIIHHFGADRERFGHLRIINRPLAPFREFRRAEFIPLHREHPVVEHPIPVLFHKPKECRVAQDCIVMLVEDLPRHTPFYRHHRLVFHLPRQIQAHPLIRQSCLIAHRSAHFIQAQIKRMQREHTDRRIRIAVVGRVSRGGVIDR